MFSVAVCIIVVVVVVFYIYILSYMCMIFYSTCGPTVKFQELVCNDTYT